MIINSPDRIAGRRDGLRIHAGLATVAGLAIGARFPDLGIPTAVFTGFYDGLSLVGANQFESQGGHHRANTNSKAYFLGRLETSVVLATGHTFAYFALSGFAHANPGVFDSLIGPWVDAGIGINLVSAGFSMALSTLNIVQFARAKE